MSDQPESINPMRMVRVPIIIDLLREQPLPAEVIVERLQKRLGELGLPVIEARRIKDDLAWILEHLGKDVIERLPRSALDVEPPNEFRHHRLFYRINGAEDLIPVTGHLLFLTELEALALVAARAQLAIPTSTRISEDAGPLAGAIDRVLRRLGLSTKDKRIPDVLAVTQSAPQSYDPRHALEILRVIRCGDSLELDYLPLDKPSHTAVVKPVRLVLVDGEPYLWAWDSNDKIIKRYKLARIQGLVRQDALPKAPAGLDAEVRQQLIGAFRGISGNKQRGHVKLRVTTQGVPHLRHRRLGSSQTWHDLPDGSARVEFQTSGMEAVRHWLLQYGANIVVEAPPSLVDWMRAEIARMAANYPTP
jgi:predicted DNA-binding transcriptional regulator YafY